MKSHLWQKRTTIGPNDSSVATITRTWRCKHCGASKTLIVRKADKSPRVTVEKIVSSESCGRVKEGKAA